MFKGDVFTISIAGVSDVNKRDNFRDLLRNISGAISSFDDRLDAQGSDWYRHYLNEAVFNITDIIFDDSVEVTELIDFHYECLTEAVVEITVNRW